MSEELSLGFHVFFLPNSGYRNYWVLKCFEHAWKILNPNCPQHVLLTLQQCRLLTSKYFRVSVIDDVLGVEALRWTLGVSPLSTAMCCSIKMWCLGKPPGLQYETQFTLCLEPGQYNLCSEDGQTKIDILNCSTCSRISCVHALESIWTYCDLTSSYLVAFSGHVWSSDRLYWRAIQYILCVCSLKNPTWDHQIHFFGVQITY